MPAVTMGTWKNALVVDSYSRPNEEIEFVCTIPADTIHVKKRKCVSGVLTPALPISCGKSNYFY